MNQDREAQTMTNDTHTPEPWKFNTTDPVESGLDIWVYSEIANRGIGWTYTEADARRIVACVNTLKGVPTKQLEEAAALGITDVSTGNLFSSRLEIEKRAAKAEQQRDELRDLLIECKRELRPGISMGLHGDMGRKLDEAIAKAGVQ